MIAFEKGIHPQKVPAGISLIAPLDGADKHVTEKNPARDVMTDLRTSKAFQTHSSASLEQVNDKMIACGVRLLFVCDNQEKLIGLITATDILGEKPLLFVTSQGGSREDICVDDIMTPLNKLEAIPFNQVLNAHVSDIVTALKDCRRHHMLVVEDQDSSKFIRGMFSATQVSKQLGIEISPSERAESFAQISKALG